MHLALHLCCVRSRLLMVCLSCVQSQLPKGSVTLASSASGSTVYMEPTPVVALNNAEAMLGAQEEEEEQAILSELTHMVCCALSTWRCV